jgi:predicted TIM-barrel fold metal-dependent hydrolase
VNPLEQVGRLRRHYLACRAALPWLDASSAPEELPYFAAHASAERIASPPSHRLVRRTPAEQLTSEELARLVATRRVLVLSAADFTCDDALEIARSRPALPIIYESGERKILYAIAAIEAMLAAAPNLHLSTYNFGNWLGIERLCGRGLHRQLLFGSHAPRHSPDAAMGPIILSRLPWEQRCAIAGDNLRWLLGEPIAAMDQIHPPPISPFIIDAHAHSVTGTSPLAFPTPDQRFTRADWLAALDDHLIERICLVPNESLYDWRASARAAAAPLLGDPRRRFRFYAVFDPRGDDAHRRRAREELAHPLCVGLKIHPSFHQVPADDPAYRTAFALALETRRPILTHSWAVSAHNPAQALSLPSRFHAHLEWARKQDTARGRGVDLLLGHAGGRPEAFSEVVELRRRHPTVRVDLAGDYYDHGLIDALAASLGPDAILFGSDADWTDPRCVLGMVLASRLEDREVALILRRNAETMLGLGEPSAATMEASA